MPMRYRVGSLDTEHIGRAFAIIRCLFPEASFEEWQEATDTQRQRHDWLTVVDAAGVIRGLCHVLPVMEEVSRRLEIPVFASVSMSDQPGVDRQLFRMLRDRAQRAHCEAIHIWPAGPEGWSAVVTQALHRIPAGGLHYDMRSLSFMEPTMLGGPQTWIH